MMKNLVLSLFALTFMACNTSPTKNAESIKNIDKADLISSPAEALKKLSAEGKLEEKKLAFKFSKNDKFLHFKGKNAPVKKVDLVIASGEKSKYLVLAGEMHNVGMAKSAGVFPEVFIFNAQNKLIKTPLAQAGFEELCGLFTCLKKAFNISALPAGNYHLVMASHVENPEEVIHMFATQVYAAGAVGAAVGSMIDQKIYADYFGEVVLAYSDKLPFAKNNKAAVTFEN